MHAALIGRAFNIGVWLCIFGWKCDLDSLVCLGISLVYLVTWILRLP